MKYLKIAYFKIFFLILAGQTMGQDIQDLSQFEFMLGTWSAEFPSGAYYESWTKESDTKFTGAAYTMRDGDSTLSETLSLEILDDGVHEGVYYIALPVLQDTTYFEMVAGTNEDAEFQNPNHDFPQIIAYKKVDADRMYVVIGSLDPNVDKQIDFNFIRVKND